MQLAGTHEVHQSLYYPVEAVNLAANDIHVATGVWIEERQLVLQQLQVKHDGIDGVLDLVSHAARHASAGREATGHLDFVSDSPYGLRVAHDQKSADLTA